MAGMSSRESGIRDAEYIRNKKPGVIYFSDLPDNDGKYISMISQDDTIDFQISPRVQFRTTFIRKNEALKGLTITKLKKKSGQFEKEGETITLSTFELCDMVSFVELLKAIDPSSITSKKLKISEGMFNTFDDETKTRLTTLLKTKEGTEFVARLIESRELTLQDISTLSYRKQQLQLFYKLLNEDGYLEQYRSQESIKDNKDEKVWQHFFKKNDWIFGLGLDYHYIDTLETEASVGAPDVSGLNEEKLDTLGGYNAFTVLVEIKKPNTLLFTSSKNRSGSWSLSSDLQAAVSQILEYKASHLEAWNSSAKFDKDGYPLKYYAYDSKAILLIGRNSQIEGEDRTSTIKRRTFELFRRDSRNIEIMTYDELYFRAKYTIEKAEKGN